MGGLDSGKVGRWEGWRQPKTQKVRFFFLKSWGGGIQAFFF